MPIDPYFSQFNNNQLTKQQMEAISCSMGPSIIVAGAGSGKTSVIAHRFIYMVQRLGIHPSRILLVTFTRQAVKNVDKRIKNYLGKCMNMKYSDIDEICKNLHVMTFHGLCKNILSWIYENKYKSETTKFVYDSKFFPILKEIMEEYPHIRARGKVKEILVHLRKICKSQHREFTEEDLLDIAMTVDTIYEKEKILQKYPYKDMKKIYWKFDAAMKKKKLGTLDDILLDANNYLIGNEDIVKEWSSRYDAILCDEFQDVDDIQFNVLTKLCSNDHNIFCVGDPDQAIYGFRGSLPQVFLKLKGHFDKNGVYTKIKKLEQNFRSTPQILDVANELINSSQVSDELRKNLQTNKNGGEVPTLQVLKNTSVQAEIVVNKIWELQRRGVKLSDIAVLARKRSNYSKIKNSLLYSSIHYEDYKEAFPLLKNKVIKDLVGWISLAFVRDDMKQWLSHFKRVHNTPPIGVGPATFQKFLDLVNRSGENVMEVMDSFAESNDAFNKLRWKVAKMRQIADKKDKTLKDKYWEIVNESGLWDYCAKKYGEDSAKLDTVKKFLDSPLVAKAKSWRDALIHVERYVNLDNKDRVVCSTIHGVKGLEFKYVFLISLSEGHIPTARGLRLCQNEEKKAAYIDDERRVLYVAITRAKDHLYLYTDKFETSIFLRDIKSRLNGEIPVVEVSEDQNITTDDESEIYEDGEDDFGNSSDVL